MMSSIPMATATATSGIAPGNLSGYRDAPLVLLTRLRRRRLEKGWTLSDLSTAAGLSRRTLSLLEQGLREPRPGNILRLAEALQCDTRDLMEPEHLQGQP
jgi:DNA-binding Xre family transcriptional regulator